MLEKKVTSQRGSVYYWIGRNLQPGAKCVVFLHGLTADHTLFEKQVEFFEKEYTVLTWDAPAHGLSRPYADFTYANCAGELKTILDAEKITSAVFVGQSMGGYVTQEFLLRYPEHVQGFVAVDSCPFGTKYYSKSDLWWLRQVEWMSRCYPREILLRCVAKQCTATVYGYNNMHAALRYYDKNELCLLMGLGYTGFLKENRDLTIPCPVLLIVGEHDITGKVLQYNRAWSKAEGYPLHIVPNAAHNSNIDNYIEVNALIWDFVEGL